MKKVILLITVVLLLFLFSIFTFSSPSENLSNDKGENNTSTFEDEESTLLGYYFHGYIDMREPFESFDEASTYMYYMNNYLEDYLNQQFVLTEGSHAENEAYIRYFEQLEDPVYPIFFQNKYDLNNGEYVKVTFKGGIMESHPAQIGEVTDVEVVNFTE
ncbi:DUF3221 domain-containing protein [Oceanobacillus sp. CFH 90083]|uniref:DUF3221 domain-containing protein n=1 Tax=Oceanobacillus sp. CFH 90083 TaxID=2592336 RepID=UPI00128CB43B